jgi:conjugative transposon TraN protein
MKQCSMIFLLLIGVGLAASAQQSIAPYSLSLSYYKTTNLIFPYAIQSVDRGSAGVLAQKARGVENILQLKAASKNFAATNVTVVTADGAFYSFLVNYAADPAILSISFAKDSLLSNINQPNALLYNQPVNAAELAATAQHVLRLPRHYRKQVKTQAIKLSLTGIYINIQTLWFKLELYNQSRVPFHPDYIRFFVQDRKRSKRTAIQETERTPLYHTAVPPLLYEKPFATAVAFTPFTIPKTQRLIIEVGERTGGRQLLLNVSARALLRANVF